MSLPVTIVSELFGDDSEQPALIRDQLTVQELLQEIQIEFQLVPGDYRLQLARTHTTLLPEQTLPAQNVKPNDNLLFQMVQIEPSTPTDAEPPPILNLTYALLRAESGQEFPIVRSSILIGRPNRQQSIVPDIDLTDVDPELSVSRPHARIFRESTDYFVESLKPDNPVVLNSMPAKPGDAQLLHDQDWLLLGAVKLQFVLRTG